MARTPHSSQKTRGAEHFWKEYTARRNKSTPFTWRRSWVQLHFALVLVTLRKSLGELLVRSVNGEAMMPSGFYHRCRHQQDGMPDSVRRDQAWSPDESFREESELEKKSSATRHVTRAAITCQQGWYTHSRPTNRQRFPMRAHARHAGKI